MSMDPGAQNAGVLITMGRVYEEVTAARKDISSLDSKVEQALKQGDDHEMRMRDLEKTSATRADLDALETRVQVVEHSDWKKTGAAAVLAALLSSGAAVALVEALAKR